MEGDVITMSELFAFERKGVDKEGNVIGSLQATGHHSGLPQRPQRKGIEVPMEVFEPTWIDEGDSAMRENSLFVYLGLVFAAVFLLSQGMIMPVFGEGRERDNACSSASRTSTRRGAPKPSRPCCASVTCGSSRRSSGSWRRCRGMEALERMIEQAGNRCSRIE